MSKAQDIVDHHHHDEHDHGSFKSYMIGFILSVILTAIPFWLVMEDVLASKQATIIIISVFALMQIVVHMIFFLHMNYKSEQGWILMALIFTAIITVIAIVGSLWVMFHMNVHMMPMPLKDLGAVF